MLTRLGWGSQFLLMGGGSPFGVGLALRLGVGPQCRGRPFLLAVGPSFLRRGLALGVGPFLGLALLGVGLVWRFLLGWPFPLLGLELALPSLGFGVGASCWVGPLLGWSWPFPSLGLELALRRGLGPFLSWVGFGPSGWGWPFLLKVGVGQLCVVKICI